jgi:lysophospholipase L1-like esterase
MITGLVHVAGQLLVNLLVQLPAQVAQTAKAAHATKATQAARVLLAVALTSLSATEIDASQHIFVLGDSHSSNQRWTNATAATLPETTWQVRARGGLTPKDALELLQKNADWARPQPPGIALVLLGTNAYDRESYQAIVDILSQEGWRVRPITCPPRQADPQQAYSTAHANFQFNTWLRQQFPTTIDCVPALRDPSLPHDRADFLRPSLARDSVHLNAAGDAILSDLISQALRKEISAAYRPNQDDLTSSGASVSMD